MDYVEIKIRVVRDQRDRLAHHARAIGKDMTDIVRDAIIERLDYLDERERARKGTKVLAPVPGVVEHPWGKPKGLGPRKKSTTADETPASPFDALKNTPYEVPEKVRKAFRSWAEYMEEADGPVDTEQRVKKIVEDLRQRVTTEKDVESCYVAFVEFCTARKDAEKKATITVPVDVPIVGDI